MIKYLDYNLKQVYKPIITLLYEYIMKVIFRKNILS